MFSCSSFPVTALKFFELLLLIFLTYPWKNYSWLTTKLLLQYFDYFLSMRCLSHNMLLWFLLPKLFIATACHTNLLAHFYIFLLQ